MVKQSLPQLCACGKVITFPEGQIKTKCSVCGSAWELGAEGFWSITAISPASPAQQIGDAMRKFIESMKKAFEKVCRFINEMAEDIDPKWLHYYKHSKKRRVRKKYERRIVSHIMNAIAAPRSKPRLEGRTRWQANR